MRIITGDKRGKKLEALSEKGVRPTTDRVKEALFNILQFRLEGRCFLDLFAGSGQIGIEAISRGAKSAVFVDNNKVALSVIKKNISMVGFDTKAKVVSSDYAVYLNNTSDVFDIAFVDPPYYDQIISGAMNLLVEHMSETGMIICEHPEKAELHESYGKFCKKKTYRYGKIYLTAYEIPEREE